MDGQVSGTHLVRKRSRTKETARLLNSKLLSGRGGEGQASDYEEKADDAQGAAGRLDVYRESGARRT